MSRIPQTVIDAVAVIATLADDARMLASHTVNKINDLNKATVAINDADEMRSVTHEIERLRGVQSQHQKTATELGLLATSLNHWISCLPKNVVLEIVEARSVALRKGETFGATVEQLRTKIAAVRQEQTRVKGAPAPAVELKRKLRDYVDERAARGRPRINTQGGKLEIDFAPTQFSSGTTRHVLDVVCWLDPERVTKQLEAALDAQPDNGRGLSAVEREEQLRSLADNLDRLERQEEAYIKSAEATGLTIPRRQQASPAAILGVMVAKVKERDRAA